MAIDGRIVRSCILPIDAYAASPWFNEMNRFEGENLRDCKGEKGKPRRMEMLEEATHVSLLIQHQRNQTADILEFYLVGQSDTLQAQVQF